MNFVDTYITQSGTSSASQAVSLDAGDVLLIFAGGYNLPGDIPTNALTDTNGNTITHVTGGNAAFQYGRLWIVANAVAGATTFTVNVGGSSRDCAIHIIRYSNSGSPPTVDDSHVGTGTGNMDAGGVTTTQTNDLIVCVGGSGQSSTTFGAGSGYTIRGNDGTDINFASMSEDMVGSTATSYATTASSAGGNYIFIAAALKKSGTTPATPTNLAAMAISATEIDLTWTDPNSGSAEETSMSIQWSTDNSTWQTPISISADATSYNHTGRTEGTNYYYQINATNSAGTSAWSSSVSCYALPDAPSSLTIVALNTDTLSLSWVDNSSTNTGFTIQYDTAEDFSSPTSIDLPVGSATTELTNVALTGGTVYYVRIFSYVDSGNTLSDSSNADSASCVGPATCTQAGTSVTAAAELGGTVANFPDPPDTGVISSNNFGTTFSITDFSADSSTWAGGPIAGNPPPGVYQVKIYNVSDGTFAICPGTVTIVAAAATEFENLDFGAFVVFGLTTFLLAENLGGEQSVDVFAPSALTKSSVDAWLDSLQAAGAKYVVWTHKHVDGLVMGTSQATTRSINHTAWFAATGFDITAYVCNGCRKRGLKIFLYFCVWDDYLDISIGGSGNRTQQNYQPYILSLLAEVVGNFGAIDGVWLDGHIYAIPDSVVAYSAMSAVIKGAQPNCLIINNTHLHDGTTLNYSDVEVFEIDVDGIPAAGDGNPVEANQSILGAGTWFCRTNVGSIDPTQAQIMMYNRWRINVKRGYNYLLNFPPDTTGNYRADVQATLDLFRDSRRQASVTKSDDFSLNGAETVGVTVQTHVTDAGDSWIKTEGASANAIISPDGAARTGNSNYVIYGLNVTPASADYMVESVFKFRTVPATYFLGSVMRALAIGGADYRAYFTQGTTNSFLRFQVNVGGASNLDGGGADNTELDLTQAITVRVRGKGTAMRALFYEGANLVTQMAATDSGISIANLPGFVFISATVDDTHGPYLDSWALLAEDYTAPGAPTGVTAVTHGPVAILVSWTAPVDVDLLVYKLYRSTDGSNYGYVSDILAGTVSYLDISVLADTVYTYKVTAVDTSFNVGSQSTASNSVKALGGVGRSGNDSTRIGVSVRV